MIFKKAKLPLNPEGPEDLQNYWTFYKWVHFYIHNLQKDYIIKTGNFSFLLNGMVNNEKDKITVKRHFIHALFSKGYPVIT